MEKAIAEAFLCEEAIRAAVQDRGARKTALYEVCDGQQAALAALLREQTGRPVIYITASSAKAARMHSDIGAWLEKERCLLMPEEETLFTGGTEGREGWLNRLKVLNALAAGEARVLCMSADSAMLPLPPMASWRRAAVTLSVGDSLAPDELMRRLQRIGYERRDLTEGPGQCSMRGDIVDVFPAGGAALRFEFFGDEIDQAKTFDPVTQRSVENLTEPQTLLPVLDTVGLEMKQHAFDMRALIAEQLDKLRLEDEKRAKARGGYAEDGGLAENAGIRAEAERCAALRESGIYRGSGMKWAAALGLPRAFLWEWFEKRPLILLDEPERVRERWRDRTDGFLADFQAALERGDALPAWEGALFREEELSGALAAHSCVTLQGMLRGMAGLKIDAAAPVGAEAAPRYASRVPDLARDLRRWRQEGWRIFLCAGGENRVARLKNALSEYNLEPDTAPGAETAAGRILPLMLSQGFMLPSRHLVLLADADIFGSVRAQAESRRKKQAKSGGVKIEAFTDLTEGDYVVHESHGVGVFRGTVRLQTEGVYRDYFLVQYRGNDKLYVPTDQFDRVQKYMTAGEETPELDSLSSNQWQKQRNKVRSSLKKLAFDLVKLYAQRQNTPGYAFAKDSPWQAEFEDAFPYALTPDQESAVEDIKRDMERPVNMDRLLCGDVGFGKTEVALRAVFKCIMSGKQAAILCPTTILAQQHFYTIQKRFRDFPVKSEVLSRFKNSTSQHQILRDLAEGKLDVIVGTHRLLGQDVRFKDLGLLVVDEEQRFGVTHKERIKHYKTQVDVLTLSATPIPRTLHMSMIGIRDMSLLQTPPEERYPVQTYVTEYSDALVRDAVNREIARQGQVYFLYNHVQHIEQFAARMRNLLPEARIAVAHGQMEGRQLENVMLDFYDHKYDVLLCSTIIENGLDVPDANTLIVYDADRYGLSQLYQLRGRVGRSTRTAFAYFTVKQDKMLSETAEKRLNAIRDFTAFGSGYRIAMRDLEIRGSGNIFGPEQSGNVAAVGYDLYCKMIEEAVEEVMPGRKKKRAETRMDLKLNAYLPTEYVSDERQRMEVFRRIAAIRGQEDRSDVVDEMIDRFGTIPDPVMNLVEVSHLRALASRLGALRVNSTRDGVLFHLDVPEDPQRLVTAVAGTDPRLVFLTGKEPCLLMKDQGKTVSEMLRDAVPVMEKAVERLEAEN